MYDLHCHLLPGIDDGPAELSVSLEMARMAVADGITTVACTPHIYPGLYDNDAPGIRAAIARLRQHLEAQGIALHLVEGADVHLAPGLATAIAEGRCRPWPARATCCSSRPTTSLRRVSSKACSN